MRAALRKNSDRVESLTRAESRFQKWRVNSRSAFNAMQDEQNERMELIASNFVVQYGTGGQTRGCDCRFQPRCAGKIG
jgi:hypothetical protein